MMDKPVVGFRIALEWINPYKAPPNGVRVLAERFVITDGGGPEFPEKWKELHELGDGYCITYSHISPPPKGLSRERLASIRKKRIVRRMQAKYPMFADEFISKEMEKNLNYYEGETDAKIEAARDEALQALDKNYQRLLREGVEVMP